MNMAPVEATPIVDNVPRPTVLVSDFAPKPKSTALEAAKTVPNLPTAGIK